MRTIIVGCVLATVLNSCASVFNQSHKNITIYTDIPSAIVYEKDTIITEKNKAILNVERSKEPLSLTAISDSLSKTLSVESRNSTEYWMNIVSNFGIGMLVDQNNPKRYTYPSKIYINSDDKDIISFKRPPIDRNKSLYLHISLPWINSFHLNPHGEDTKTNIGFWGLALGLDYWYSSTSYLSGIASWNLDIAVPVPAVIDYSGEHDFMSSRYIGVTHNHNIKRWTLGYGVVYAENEWEHRYYEDFGPPPPVRAPVKKRHNTFGCVFPIYYRLTNHVNLGVLYRPTLLKSNSESKSPYEHLISIDLAWKIRVKK